MCVKVFPKDHHHYFPSLTDIECRWLLVQIQYWGKLQKKYGWHDRYPFSFWLWPLLHKNIKLMVFELGIVKYISYRWKMRILKARQRIFHGQPVVREVSLAKTKFIVIKQARLSLVCMCTLTYLRVHILNIPMRECETRSGSFNMTLPT